MSGTVEPIKASRWDERLIATAVGRQILHRRCVLLVDRCNWTGHECDVLGVTTDLRIIDVEIKISRSDLRVDAGKDKWWRHFPSSRQGGQWVRPEPVRREWPRRVWKHYYAMPADIWRPDLIDSLPSAASGVVLLEHHQQMPGAVPVEIAKVVRRATPNRDAYRLSPEEVMDVARLANLRMWNAYESLAALAPKESKPL